MISTKGAVRCVHAVGSGAGATPDVAHSRFRMLPQPAERKANRQLHPSVWPQVMHFMQVPLRTMVKLPQLPQASPS